MSDVVVCLGCGGAVDEGAGIPEEHAACSCPPPPDAAMVRCSACGGVLRVGVRACPFCRSTVATARCGHCTGWNLADARHCQHCGRTLAAASPADPTAPSGRTCPRCGHGLVARIHGELDFDECDACGGLMVRPATMDRIVASRDAPTNLRLALPKRPYERETRVTYLSCPACGSSMNRKAFGRISGVIVDVCRAHGVWFDAGELAEVLAFVERGGLERAREREAEELGEVRRRAVAEQAAAAVQATLAVTVPSSRGGWRVGAEILRSLADLWA